ncbi:MAG: two-component sensor histidine kinase, partial [Phototrophicales bacterium]
DGMEDKLRALVKLVNYDDTYLYVSRYVDAKVLKHLEATRKGAKEYQALRGSSTKIQIMITSIYLVIALLIMTSAIWFALNLARRIVEPIGKLISATEAVRSGNLSARAYTGHTGDEFEMLGKAFNRMT